MNLRLPGIAGITIMTALGIAAIQSQWTSAHELAREEYIKDASSETRTAAITIEQSFRSIYENLRTLSSLPGVRGLDRHGGNLTPETRVTIQQIYNNLAASVSVSEVYFTPIDFDPARLDPLTGKTEEPIIMFDELILNAGLNMSYAERFNEPTQVKAAGNAGPEEVESFEYAQLKDHAAWLITHHPTISTGGTLDVPLISGPEVVTCDNTSYILSHKDADRSGVIFSVPFYGANGRIRGMVSAIILTKAIQSLIHSGKYALVNPGNNYVATSRNSTIPATSLPRVAEGERDPALVYSEAIAFGVKDWRNPWTLWAGLPDSAFTSSKNAKLANESRKTSLLVLGLLALAALGGLLVSDRLVRQSRALAANAREREESARETARHFHALNDDISRLNTELTGKIIELKAAQDEIISKGKMAQLGQVVSMVAHEVRNPLGGIRTSTYLLQRKLQEANLDFSGVIDRIETGIKRCDNIISQLLDFSRTSNPGVQPSKLDDWLAEALNEEAQNLPESVNVTCSLGLGETQVAFSPERMRRALVNLLSNACEAMMDANKVPIKHSGPEPQINITTRLSSRGAEIMIEDNGPGIAPEVLERIREPLFTTKSFGTGLGVPAVEKIAELHGGGLDITSTPGRGSCFTLWMPLSAPSAATASAA